MRHTYRFRRLAVPVLAFVLLLGLNLAPAALAAPDRGLTASAWTRSLPDRLYSWAESLFWSEPEPGCGDPSPVAVYERAGSGIDPNGTPGSSEASAIDDPTEERGFTKDPNG